MAISGHQWPSVAISAKQWPSVAISGHHQWQSKTYLDGGAAREADEEDVERSEQPDDRDHHLVRYAREYPRKEDLPSSGVIRGHQRSSVIIRGTHAKRICAGEAKG